ncbi:conserved hypothetical protein [Sphingobacterium multivorum]|uniref:Uncharacterized protein n=1 Tax=Sphingobacterium multivorum TaxID=28454 RepID=A0A654BUB2_SPHMU|nr:conserved hypothetical protein [Sphingobacterium multivorum]
MFKVKSIPKNKAYSLKPKAFVFYWNQLLLGGHRYFSPGQFFTFLHCFMYDPQMENL